MGGVVKSWFSKMRQVNEELINLAQFCFLSDVFHIYFFMITIAALAFTNISLLKCFANKK